MHAGRVRFQETRLVGEHGEELGYGFRGEGGAVFAGFEGFGVGDFGGAGLAVVVGEEGAVFVGDAAGFVDKGAGGEPLAAGGGVGGGGDFVEDALIVGEPFVHL